MSAVGLACAGGGAPAVAAATASAPPRASLSGFVCERSADPLNRVVAVTGVMRAVAGAPHLQMRFVLLRRPRGSRWFTSVHGGDLGRWLEPKSSSLGRRSSDVWRLRKLVANLVGPSAYRFRVTFRWLKPAGASLPPTTLLSALCPQP